MGSITIKKSLALLFLVCGIALVVSNTLLASRVAKLQRLDDFFNRSNKLQLGEHVPPMVGYDLTGKKVSYGYGADDRDTLLLVLSPACHACDDNWPNWTRLARELKNQNTRLMIANVSTGSPLTSDYVAKHEELATAAVVAEVSAESMEAYKFAYTPQTILIAADGKVLRVHTGKLKEADLALQNWTDPESASSQSQSSMSFRP